MDDGMEHEDRNDAVSFITGAVAGALLGAGIALLLAPRSGARTRRRIARRAEDLGDTARERLEDAADDVRRRAEHAARAATRKRDHLLESVQRGDS